MSEESKQIKRPSPADEIAELKTVIVHLQSQIARLSGPPAEITPAEMNRRSWIADKTKAKIAEQERLRKEAEDQLLEGPVKYEVSLTGEPRMARVVGASKGGTIGQAEARFKYERYFGILAILDPDKTIVIKPMQSEQLAVA